MTNRLLLLLILLPITATAQAQTGRIQGIVVKDGTADPIAGVQILVDIAGEGAPGGRGQRGAAANVVTAKTDRSGRFAIDDVPPGTRTITAQLDGYFGPSKNGTVPSDVSAGVAVVAQQTTDVKLMLVPGGAIAGRITDANGKLASDVEVQVLRFTYLNGLPTLEPSGTKTSDDRGEYRLYKLAPGDYYVAAISRQAGGNRGGARGGRAGAIAPSSAAPVRTFYPGTTDVSRAVVLNVRPGEETPNANMSLRAETSATLSGRISSEVPASAELRTPGPRGQRAQGQSETQTQTLDATTALLTLYLHDKNSVAPQSSLVTMNVSLNGPDAGKFQIPNVPPGIYDLIAAVPDATGYGANNPPGQAGNPFGFGRTTVDVRGGDVDGIGIHIHPGVDVKGRVTLEGTSDIAGLLRISLQPDDIASRIQIYQQVGRFQPMIDTNGTFTIPAVPEGQYRFLFTFDGQTQAPGPRGGRGGQRAAPARGASPPTPAIYIDDVRQGGVSIYDSGIRVAMTPVDTIEVHIQSGAGSIEGTVVGADQKPAPSMTVVLIPSPSRRQNLNLYRTVDSDSMGKFTLANLEPGEYKLFAWEDLPSGAYQNPEYVRKFEDRGSPVTVTRSSTVSMNVALIPAGLSP